MLPVEQPKRSGRHRLYLHATHHHVGLVGGGVPGRFFSLLGVWFDLGEYADFADDLNRLKRRIFGPRYDDPVILRRRDIRGRRGPFARLNDAKEEARFMSDLVGTIERAPFTVVSAVMELPARGAERSLAPHACMAAVLKRYAGWLGFRKAKGDAMGQCAGGREDRALRVAFADVYSEGIRHMPKDRFQKTLSRGRLAMRPSAANVAGLQLAGLLAPPVLAQRLVEHLRVRESYDEFDDKLRKIADAKFNRKETTGQVSGYGTAWIRPSGLEKE